MGGSSHHRPQELEELVSAYCGEPSEILLEKIIAAASPLVYHYAHRYSWGVVQEDLVQSGFEGLLKALKNFEPERKTLFSTYASYYIIGEICREIRRGTSFYKPAWLEEIQQKIKQATEQLRQSLGREPTIDEIAEAVNIRREGVVQAMVAGSVLLEELDLSQIRSLRYESFQLPVEERILVKEALSKLSDLQKKIVYLIFYQEMTQTKVAELIGLNQRRVSRMIKRIQEQLSSCLLM